MKKEGTRVRWAISGLKMESTFVTKTSVQNTYLIAMSNSTTISMYFISISSIHLGIIGIIHFFKELNNGH